jgi:hypothetical protein
MSAEGREDFTFYLLGLQYVSNLLFSSINVYNINEIELTWL